MRLISFTPIASALSFAFVLALALPAPRAAGQPAPADQPSAPMDHAAMAGSPMAGPVGAIHAHLCGFHFYNGAMSRQVRAEHYCSHLNADVWQCVIYESDRRNARLIGVEYIISEALFTGLAPAEKRLWHSHRYEVMSGQLVAPGMPAAAERQLMADFSRTYGKTWYLWQVDRGDTLPLGLPKLMMGFTADGQADPALVAARDKDDAVDSAAVKAGRADLPAHAIAPGADAWSHGDIFQISDTQLLIAR